MTRGDVRLLVLAKQPVPGRVKTRLCPPCDLREAALIARASLRDTLGVVAATPARRRMLVLQGRLDEPLPAGIDVIPQRGDGLDERLACAFEDAGVPSLLIGMDTPQVTPQLLGDAMQALMAPGTDAVLGATMDGGYWAIGLGCADPFAFLNVPMSTARTFESQHERLVSLGLACRMLPPLVDVDRFEDALLVAEEVPGGRFAGAVGNIARRLEAVG